jgi:hypothetical protein
MMVTAHSGVEVTKDEERFLVWNLADERDNIVVKFLAWKSVLVHRHG